jgi:hypothetical protein
VIAILALISFEAVVAIRLERIVDMVEVVRILEPMSGLQHLMQQPDYCKRSIVVGVVDVWLYSWITRCTKRL